MVDCKNCIDKCPQAEQASLIAKDRMYKTQLLVEYIKLGTVEELRSAKEKQTAKKPIDNHHCPFCKTGLPHRGITDEWCRCCFDPDFCPECGQRLDWSDFE